MALEGRHGIRRSRRGRRPLGELLFEPKGPRLHGPELLVQEAAGGFRVAVAPGELAAAHHLEQQGRHGEHRRDSRGGKCPAAVLAGRHVRRSVGNQGASFRW
jgi:hypothetical protein